MTNAALHVARTGLDAQNMRMRVIANNLANVNTTGFRRDRADFESLAYQQMVAAGAPVISSSSTSYTVPLTLTLYFFMMRSSSNFLDGYDTDSGNVCPHVLSDRGSDGGHHGGRYGRRCGSRLGDRGGHGLARDKNQFQVERVGQRDQACRTQIDRRRLDARDLGLR